MTDSWADLFERAAEHDVSEADVRTRLDAMRGDGDAPSSEPDDERNGGDDA